ncbi:LLM class flavin-dependent oxidoreductase [Corynebacterium caspium]|uniref:LLM class flavin-dependent oxidoreductase n=1 Tax=Corynebacterium caspium TaxID=234828 RepID=UPI00038038C8|nr:LLM class flavin-dependent oxidoreductase [Corynebacterium caspium]WKD58642.1 Alkanal monooxygenase alpha chain [Corynebacterium caspium DSM 44850]
MKYFGFLSFGHHAIGQQQGPSAADVLKQSVDIAQAADEIGVNGAFFRVHHFAPQGAAPFPLLGAIAASTKRLEIGTGVIDLRYENPLYLAEEVAALDLLADQRTAIGVSRGSPEPADKGWEAFGYKGEAENGADIAHEKWGTFMDAIRGQGFATAAEYGKQYPRLYPPGIDLPIFPYSPGVDKRIWWGSGTNATAIKAAQDGVNLMSSTLVSEADGSSLADLQYTQIQHYRKAWKDAGHDWEPRVSVSRSIFPIVSGNDQQLFGALATDKDEIGAIEGATRTTFGRTYAAAPDVLIEQLKADKAVMDADTLLLTIPNTMGVEINQRILENFAKYVAPALGWEPGTPRYGA